MTFGQNYVEYVQEWMRLNKSPKVSWRILSELADEFMQKREASMKAQKENEKKAKKKAAASRSPLVPEGEAGIIPPTREMVERRCKDMGYTFSIDAFFGHYEGNGWMKGKVRLVNWYGACVTFQGKDPKRLPSGAAPTKPTVAAIPEPGEGWRERVKDHEDLGRWSEAVWEQIMPYYQRQIVRFLREAA